MICPTNAGNPSEVVSDDETEERDGVLNGLAGGRGLAGMGPECSIERVLF